MIAQAYNFSLFLHVGEETFGGTLVALIDGRVIIWKNRVSMLKSAHIGDVAFDGIGGVICMFDGAHAAVELLLELLFPFFLLVFRPFPFFFGGIAY